MAKEHNRSRGYVYFMRPEGRDWVKIGWAKNVAQRRIDLQCACPDPLVILHAIPGSLRTESRVRGCLTDTQGRGEWKRYDNDVRLLIETLKSNPGRERMVIDLAHAFRIQAIKRRILVGRSALLEDGFSPPAPCFPPQFDAADQLIATLIPYSSMGEA